MSRQIIACLFFFSLAVLLIPMNAADPTGTISGTVLDSSGAPIPRARVTAANIATSLTRETLTASDGGFIFPLVPVGPYTVAAEAPGFRRFVQNNVTIATDVNVTVPIILQLGDVTETVTVEARAGLVETRSGTLGQVVTQQKIVELPLNGRNAATLVLLSPGTADLGATNARGAGDVTHSADYPGAQAITSNGSRTHPRIGTRDCQRFVFCKAWSCSMMLWQSVGKTAGKYALMQLLGSASGIYYREFELSHAADGAHLYTCID
jgi:hypothetical protein